MNRLQAKQRVNKTNKNCLVRKQLKQLISYIVMIACFLVPGGIYAIDINEDSEHIAVSIDVEIPVQTFSSSKSDKTDYILLWMPSESGILAQEIATAKQLAASGVEVWLADLHGGWFVEKGRSSIDKFKEPLLANLIEGILEKSGKKIYLFSNSRGVISLLRAARGWQKKYPKKNADPAQPKIAGAILLSGQFYSRTPEPGFDGVFNTIVNQTRLRLMLLQPNKSPWFWKLPSAKKAFEKAGSRVNSWIVKGVRDRFYYRPDATPVEDKKAKQLTKMIFTAINILDGDATPIPVAASTEDTDKQIASAKKVKKYKNRGLAVWRGNGDRPGLILENLAGNSVDLDSYKGKVVLVNFWASWCPPCVHEMPSMQKLEDQLKDKGFSILAVNMAEKRSDIKNFIANKVKVNFEIVLDSDGAALKKWKVYAFPTSYLLGKKGKVRYAVYGAIDWNSESVHKAIMGLINE